MSIHCQRQLDLCLSPARSTPPTPCSAHPAGQRALGFVLGNQGLIDKTLLFDIELIKVAA